METIFVADRLSITSGLLQQLIAFQGEINNFFKIIYIPFILCRTTTAILNSMRVVFGLHDRLTSDSWVIQRGVQRIVVHPQYSSQTLSNDIALIQLSVSIYFYLIAFMEISYLFLRRIYQKQSILIFVLHYKRIPNHSKIIILFYSRLQLINIRNTICLFVFQVWVKRFMVKLVTLLVGALLIMVRKKIQLNKFKDFLCIIIF